MMKLPSLQLYVLQHPEIEQAAWVKANTGTEASTKLSSRTDIPVIVSNDYEWVLFPEGHRHKNDDERPLPHWEYRDSVNGPADLKGMPEYIRVLGEKRPPQHLGQVSIGRKFTRSTPLDLRSIPAAPIAGQVEAFRSGYNTPYPFNASQISGFNGNPDSIELGKTAVLDFFRIDELHSKEGHVAKIKWKDQECPKVGDTLKIRMKSENGDYFVTARVVREAVIVHVVSIEKSK